MYLCAKHGFYLFRDFLNPHKFFKESRVVMRLFIKDYDNFYHCFSLNFTYVNYIRIFVNDICIFDIYKIHNHHYYFKCFFYTTKFIFCSSRITRKKDLYGAIQELLQKNLYDVVQN